MKITKMHLPIDGVCRGGRLRKSTQGVVFHYTASPMATARNIYNWFANMKDNNEELARRARKEGKKFYPMSASYNYVIDDKEIIELMPPEEESWHAFDGHAKVRGLGLNANKTTISVAFCIRSLPTPLPETIELGKQLSVALMQKYSFYGVGNAWRHYDVTGKNCPAHFVENPKLWEDFKLDCKHRLEDQYKKIEWEYRGLNEAT